MRFVYGLVLSASVLCPTAGLAAGAHPVEYVRSEVTIPMRDGIHLHAVVLRPAPGSAHARELLPILLDRTPYGAQSTTAASVVKGYAELAAKGYLFVFEDIRGRYGSEGTFAMMRPLAEPHDALQFPKDIDESTDAYDTVGWLIAHLPKNNGRVGVFGVSYDGFLTAMAGIDAHPAVKAISPQAPMTDVWQGDDFFHNGAFRQTYGYDYALGMESTKENAFGKLNEDAYDYFLNAGSFEGAVRRASAGEHAAALPTWQALLAHPAYDEYWEQRSVPSHLDRVNVPVLEVGGWWDQEDMWGPQAQYAALRAYGKDARMVLGPWNHGQWRGEARSLGVLDFGQATGAAYREQVEVPFFEHYLRPTRSDRFTLSTVTSFQTGSNTWKHYESWPPADHTEPERLYLGQGQSLAFQHPADGSQSCATVYVSDPAKPVPYRARPVEATYAPTGSHWYTWLAEDQRAASARPDVASWKTPPLAQPMTVTGEATADLFASTSGSDSDWIVKLIDQYPDVPSQGKMAGYQLMIASEIFRGRYRESKSKPKAIEPNQVEEYRFSLHGVDHVFLPEHRIMVQVQSSWFPLYDRNPQTYVPNIMTAKSGDYRSATQRVFCSTSYPSHLELPMVRRAAAQ